MSRIKTMSTYEVPTYGGDMWAEETFSPNCIFWAEETVWRCKVAELVFPVNAGMSCLVSFMTAWPGDVKPLCPGFPVCKTLSDWMSVALNARFLHVPGNNARGQHVLSCKVTLYRGVENWLTIVWKAAMPQFPAGIFRESAIFPFCPKAALNDIVQTVTHYANEAFDDLFHRNVIATISVSFHSYAIHGLIARWL